MQTKTKVKKWGNSLALRIPKPIVEALQIESDSVIEISVANDALIVVPVKAPAPTLAQLLDEITPENIHAEVETGAAVGAEVW